MYLTPLRMIMQRYLKEVTIQKFLLSIDTRSIQKKYYILRPLTENCCSYAIISLILYNLEQYDGGTQKTLGHR